MVLQDEIASCETAIDQLQDQRWSWLMNKRRAVRNLEMLEYAGRRELQEAVESGYLKTLSCIIECAQRFGSAL